MQLGKKLSMEDLTPDEFNFIESIVQSLHLRDVSEETRSRVGASDVQLLALAALVRPQ